MARKMPPQSLHRPSMKAHSNLKEPHLPENGEQFSKNAHRFLKNAHRFPTGEPPDVSPKMILYFRVPAHASCGVAVEALWNVLHTAVTSEPPI